MYGIKNTEDFNFLTGKKLIQVCFSNSQIILNFSEDISISIECVFYFGNKENNLIQLSNQDIPKSKELVNLVGLTIQSANSQAHDKLRILFANNYQLVLTDSNKSYESFEIRRKNKSIIV